MILYVNGDSHTAAAEAVNQHAFANDDPHLVHLGRLPHPENLAHSWGKILSTLIRAGFHCDAESAASNARIIRTTREWIKNNINTDRLVIIQWSTWEREEWLDETTKSYYQVNASGTDQVPQGWQEKYKQYILGIDWDQKTKEAHDQIWNFHQELVRDGIKHIFFNGNNNFSKITDQKDWGKNYVEPYNSTKTFDSILTTAGIETVSPNSYHFGKDGHSFFSRFMLQYIIDNKFI